MATNNSSDYKPTQYNVQVGGSLGTLSDVAPSAASGIPLISAGSSANPSFGTALVPGGGTGAVSFTAHGVILGEGTSALGVTAVGTTGQVLTGVTASDPVWAAPAASSISITGNSGGALTGNAFTFTGGTTGLTFAGAGSTETLGGTLAIANGGTNATSMTDTDGVVYYDGTRLVTTAVGTATNVLTSNGAGVAPTFQAAGSLTTAFNSVVVQTFTGNGTYTPTSGMKYCTIEVVAGGGGGGGCGAASASNASLGGGGGGGGYARKTVTAATIGASQSVTVGGGGTAGTSAPTSGGTGSTTSVGSIVSATGGVGGTSGTQGGLVNQKSSAGGVGSSGDFNINGSPSTPGFSSNVIGFAGGGGSSYFGGGARAIGNADAAAGAGISGLAYGGGAGGGFSSNTGGAAQAGGTGGAGVVVITEFVH